MISQFLLSWPSFPQPRPLHPCQLPSLHLTGLPWVFMQIWASNNKHGLFSHFLLCVKGNTTHITSCIFSVYGHASSPCWNAESFSFRLHSCLMLYAFHVSHISLLIGRVHVLQCACRGAHVEVRGPPVGAGVLFPLCYASRGGAQGTRPGCRCSQPLSLLIRP